MTFHELYEAIHGSNPSMAAFNAALAQIRFMKPDIYACWQEYKGRRLEARHAR